MATNNVPRGSHPPHERGDQADLGLVDKDPHKQYNPLTSKHTTGTIVNLAKPAKTHRNHKAMGIFYPTHKKDTNLQHSHREHQTESDFLESPTTTSTAKTRQTAHTNKLGHSTAHNTKTTRTTSFNKSQVKSSRGNIPLTILGNRSSAYKDRARGYDKISSSSEHATHTPTQGGLQASKTTQHIP